MSQIKHIFVSGSTGYVGHELTLKLINQGHKLHLFVRNASKAKELFDAHQVLIFESDFNNDQAIDKAMKSCSEAYLIAGITKPWLKDTAEYFKIHVDANKRFLNIAAKNGVKKVVVTSTAGVFGPSSNGAAVNENTIRSQAHFNDYEKSKDMMADMIMHLDTGKMKICIVNPSRIYGPGKMGIHNPVNKLIKLYLKGKWHYIPGSGLESGNYVFIDDVIKGHLLAMKSGADRNSFIIGGAENISYNDFFALLGKLSGKTQKMINTPIGLIKVISYVQLFSAKYFGIQPLFTPDWVDRYYYDWPLSIDKAKEKLEYSPTPLKTGLERSIQWLKASD